ncbi:hypothetical protein [uncultured Lamprocystis sp.]|uniref:hypothetical protein n=1 Tax=uncultured Lamprocystis sp. TaxID=543132 RepID=UPI0025E4195A|nr:hypothetical protein [uncultured Lamprocystis sp.]
MRKATTDSPANGQDGGRRGQWVRAHPPPPVPAEETAAPRPPQARFLEPYRLSDAQREALLAPLIAAAVGDAESHALFVSAIAYDLAKFRRAALSPEPEVAPPPDTVAPPLEQARSNPTLEEIVATANILAGRLRGLSDTERAAIGTAMRACDRFQRTYDDDYFDALRGELERVSVAVARLTAHPTPVSPSRTMPIFTDIGRRFVRRLAQIYEQCLDTKPAATPDSPFIAVLILLAAAAGVSLPSEPAAVAAVLADKVRGPGEA